MGKNREASYVVIKFSEIDKYLIMKKSGRSLIEVLTNSFTLNNLNKLCLGFYFVQAPLV